MVFRQFERQVKDLIKGLLRVASPPGPNGRLSTFIFHRVLQEPDPIFPGEMHARRFDDVCNWIKSWFNVMPLDIAVVRLKEGRLPTRSACITFDDGYADNHDVALPILQRHGLTATFFVATGFLDGGRMWNDTIVESIRLSSETTIDLGNADCFRIWTLAEKAVAINAQIQKIKYLSVQERLAVTENLALVAKVRPPDNLMMTSIQVKSLRRMGMQIGAHTVSHPILARLSDDEARAEIKGSKETLEYLLGEPVDLFAYPNGKPGADYSPASVAIAQAAGFSAAVSTAWGAARTGGDDFQIPRFTPWDHSRLRFGLRVLANIYR